MLLIDIQCYLVLLQHPTGRPRMYVFVWVYFQRVILIMMTEQTGHKQFQDGQLFCDQAQPLQQKK